MTFVDKRDELVPKHRTPELASPHLVQHETTGVYTRRKIDSVSTSIDQLKIDQQRQNNQQEAHARKLVDLDSRVGRLAVDVVGIAGQNKTLIAMNGRQLDILGDIAKKRADTNNDLAKVSAKARWKIAVIVATGIFGTGGIAAIIAIALTKGCG